MRALSKLPNLHGWITHNKPFSGESKDYITFDVLTSVILDPAVFDANSVHYE
jgi:hypothetical protein